MEQPDRLISVVGPAGVGKTALALTALDDPILWDFGSARSVDEALDALAVTLGVGSAGSSHLQHIGDAFQRLAGRPLWIDHADRWQQPVLECLAGWWLQTPELQVVWTGRLHLPAAMGPPLVMEPLVAEDALALFAQRASPTGRLPDDWAADAPALVQRLGGLPLVLELAASWTTLLTPADLLRRTDRLSPWLLSAPEADESVDRLRSAVQWSWSMLDPGERRLAASCACRPAGLFLEDFEAVASAIGMPQERLAGALRSLRRHSLLRTETSADQGQRRLMLYEPVRAFVASQLAELPGDVADVETELLVARAERAGDDFAGAHPLRGLQWLQTERPNLLAAMDRERHQRPQWAARAALALAPLLTTRGPWPTQHRILRDAVLCAEASGDEMLVAETARELGTGLIRRGRFGEADRALKGSYEGLSGRSADPVVARSLIVHAHVLAWLDDDSAARTLLQRAERIVERCDPDIPEVLPVSVGLGMQRAFVCRRIRTDEGLSEAYSHIESATVQADTQNLVRAGYLCRYIRGQILLDLDRPAEAYASFEAAIEGLIRIGETVTEASGHQWMARAARHRGELTLATEHLERGIGLAQRSADLESELYLQAEWVEHHLSQQQFDEARQSLEETRRLAARTHLAPARKIPEQLQAQLDRLDRPQQAVPAHEQIVLAHDASGWTQHDSRVSLAARPTLRRVLARLVEGRERTPGQMLDRQTLFAAGWPGETIQPKSRHQRIYTAIWTLRKLGLGAGLLSTDEGYALCPARTKLDTGMS